jgi:DNA-binding NarL/FixJ family response regulator
VTGFNINWVNVDQVIAKSRCPLEDESGADLHTTMGLRNVSDGQPYEPVAEKLKQFTVGLIDFYRLTKDCLMEGLCILRPEIKIFDFVTVQDCMAERQDDFELILYHLHGTEVSAQTVAQDIALIRNIFPSTPVVIFSDTDRLRQTAVMHSILEAGARGFVPVQTTGLPIISAMINLVAAGGTFVPTDLLLAPRPNRRAEQQTELTPRQRSVLGHLRQGKANKIIAYELGMSQSTVKVHVRNIMRKMGANNRTHAAYKAEMQWSCAESAH